MSGRLHVFENNIPKVRVIDLELIVGIVADKSALGEGARTTDKRVLCYSRVVLDNVVNVSLEEGFLLALLSVL